MHTSSLLHPCKLIVGGGSAGAIAALRQLVGALPRVFPATMLVALHAPPHDGAARTLFRHTDPLPVVPATDGDTLAPGRVLLVPRDRHLLVEPGRVRLTLDPEKHRFRPAIDPLFRTAARVYGPRVIGVVLTGANADGTAGLLNVVLHGGVAIVQDPAAATSAEMPRSALTNVPGALCLPLAEIGPRLVRLAMGPDAGWALPARALLDLDQVKALAPDVIVHDLVFGGDREKDWAFLTGTRRDPQLARVPPVPCTADHTVNDEAMAAQLQRQGVRVVLKPFDLTQLLEVIGEAQAAPMLATEAAGAPSC